MGWKLHNTGECKKSVSRRNFFGLFGGAWKDPSNLFTLERKWWHPWQSVDGLPKTRYILCLLKRCLFKHR